MTYPADDNGNPRVDFVWGNMPIQPNDQRPDTGSNTTHLGNSAEDRGWGAVTVYPSNELQSGTVTKYLSVGDQSVDVWWQTPSVRPVTVELANHNIVTEGYSNYPAYIPNYAGDGDTAFEAVVPNVNPLSGGDIASAITSAGFVYAVNSSFVGATLVNDGKVKAQNPAAGAVANLGATVTVTLFAAPTVPDLVGLTDPGAAETALTNAGLQLGNTNSSTDGATALNNLKVKSQSVVAGTKVDAGTVVDIVVYDYVAPVVNHTIAGIRRDGLGNTQRHLYLYGRNSGITVGSTIVLSDTGFANYNRPFDVTEVINDDSFNTGGQRILINNGLMTLTDDEVTNTGTWAFM